MAQELWPLVEWSLNYCHNKRNEQGAVESESDEMEGRIPTGTANLSTSSLYYGGLKYASLLAMELDLPEQAEKYKRHQQEMEAVIENYFGANIEGLLGIEPLGFDQFSLSPKLPDTWDKLELKALSFMNSSTDITIINSENIVRQVRVCENLKTLFF